MSDKEIFDITFVGGGPTGLYGAFYAGMRGMKTRIIDSLPQLGGSLSALYPEKHIYDVAGFPKVLAKDLVKNLVEQALRFNPSVHLNEKVAKIESNSGMFTLFTPDGEYISRSVVIAAGPGAFTPKKLDIPQIDALEGRGIYYLLDNKESVAGKNVLVVGGGDTALDYTFELLPIASKVVLIHKFGREKFQAHEHAVSRLFESAVDVYTNHELKEIHGADRLEAVTVFSNADGGEKTFTVDAVFLCIGFVANLGPIKEWGLSIEKNGILVDSSMMSNIPGIYAAGDIARYYGKIKLITTGASEAAVAVNFAKNFLDPASKVQPPHSSHMKKD